MSEHHYSDAILEAILLRSPRPLIDAATDEQSVVVPSWISDGLQKIFAEIEGESLPEEFVILFRHLNEAEHL
jgi:hypothetical protein